jgi:hypothetical protein
MRLCRAELLPSPVTGPQKKTLRRLALAFGICAAGASLAGAPAAGAAVHDDAYVVIVRHPNVPGGTISEAAVPCPSGERAIGGGVTTDSDHHSIHIEADNPLEQDGLTLDTDDGDVPRWWYTALHNDFGDGETVSHYAICSASSDATVETQAFTVPAYSGPPAPQLAAVAHCPAGTRAIGGGIGMSSAIAKSRYIYVNQPSAGGANLADSGEVSDWYAGVVNYSNAAVSMKTIAVCSAASTATVQATTFAAATVTGGSAVCPGGGVATGGGYGRIDTTEPERSDWSGSAPATAAGAPSSVVGDAPHGWYGKVNGLFNPATYRVYALCESGAATGVAATGRRAAALKKCKKKHSKKARRKCRKKAARLPL